MPNFPPPPGLPPVPQLAPPNPRPLLGGVKVQERALLVVSAGLSKFAGREGDDPKNRGFRALYDFLQKNGASLPQQQMKSSYAEVVILEASHGSPGTLVAVFNSLERLAGKYKAVDLIVHCHGLPGELVFEDGEFKVEDMAKAAMYGGTVDVIGLKGVKTKVTLRALPATSRQHLRVVLETACFGESHMKAWRDIGFAAAAGAHAIHADSWISFPTFLTWWGRGFTFGEAIDAANRADGARVTDRAVAPQFPGIEVNSQRRTSGNLRLDLSSPPSGGPPSNPPVIQLPRPPGIK